MSSSEIVCYVSVVYIFVLVHVGSSYPFLLFVTFTVWSMFRSLLLNNSITLSLILLRLTSLPPIHMTLTLPHGYVQLNNFFSPLSVIWWSKQDCENSLGNTFLSLFFSLPLAGNNLRSLCFTSLDSTVQYIKVQ
jgi:hypothetical protein